VPAVCGVPPLSNVAIVPSDVLSMNAISASSPGRGMVIRGEFPSPWSLPSASSLTFLASDLGRYRGEQSRYEPRRDADVTKTQEDDGCQMIIATVVDQLFF